MGNRKGKPGFRRKSVCRGTVLLALLLMASVSADNQRAEVEALRQAADRGSMMDQAVLGNLYLHGTGITQDYQQAFYWINRAAQQGGAFAQHDLGYMFHNGYGVSRDYQQAARWYHKAANQGFGPSQLGMSVMFALGQGVPQSYVRAHKWASLAAVHMDQSAGVHGVDPGQREAAIRYRDAVAVHMSREEVSEAQRLADAWQPQSPPQDR
jgi:uncharacterized protein